MVDPAKIDPGAPAGTLAAALAIADAAIAESITSGGTEAAQHQLAAAYATVRAAALASLEPPKLEPAKDTRTPAERAQALLVEVDRAMNHHEEMDHQQASRYLIRASIGMAALQVAALERLAFETGQSVDMLQAIQATLDSANTHGWGPT